MNALRVSKFPVHPSPISLHGVCTRRKRTRSRMFVFVVVVVVVLLGHGDNSLVAFDCDFDDELEEQPDGAGISSSLQKALKQKCKTTTGRTKDDFDYASLEQQCHCFLLLAFIIAQIYKWDSILTFRALQKNTTRLKRHSSQYQLFIDA